MIPGAVVGLLRPCLAPPGGILSVDCPDEACRRGPRVGFSAHPDQAGRSLTYELSRCLGGAERTCADAAAWAREAGALARPDLAGWEPGEALREARRLAHEEGGEARAPSGAAVFFVRRPSLPDGTPVAGGALLAEEDGPAGSARALAVYPEGELCPPACPLCLALNCRNPRGGELLPEAYDAPEEP